MSWGKRFSIALGAGGSITLPGGRYFKLIQAAADVTVEVFTASGEPLAIFENIRTGLSFDIRDISTESQLIGFGRVKITSATAQTVAALVSRQPVDYDNVSATVTVDKATTASDTADQAIANNATVTIPANSSRRSLIIYAKATNTLNLRTGPTAAAARGRELQPGMEHIWNTTAEIKIHNDTGASQTFGYAEEAD